MGKVIYMSKVCMTDGCDRKQHARGHCHYHYLRLYRAGVLAAEIAASAERGHMRQHPLYTRWSKLSTSAKLCPEWMDFWVFAAGVGDAAGRTKILRNDKTRPYGPDNFFWAEKLEGERKRAYYRHWYKHAPQQRDKKYRDTYGITLADYEALSASQNNVCDICKGPETKLVRPGINDDARRLAVDHDHETGEVRGLLCADCNRALGMFNDNSDLIMKAARYLEKHRKPRLRVV